MAKHPVFFTNLMVFGKSPQPEIRVLDITHFGGVIPHYHEFFELAIVASGQGIHVLYGKDGEPISDGIMQGDTLFLPPGASHSYSCCRNMRLFNIIFSEKILSEEEKNDLSLTPGLPSLASSCKTEPKGMKMRLGIQQRARVKELANAIIKERGEKKPGFQTAMKAALLELLIISGRQPQEELPSVNPSRQELFRHQAIAKAIGLMEKNLSKNISMEILAKEACLSASYLSHVFKAHTGMSPWNYMVKLRLEKAKMMLSCSDMPISEIVGESGFCDSSHFAKAFKKHEGMSPKKYRVRSKSEEKRD